MAELKTEFDAAAYGIRKLGRPRLSPTIKRHGACTSHIRAHGAAVTPALTYPWYAPASESTTGRAR